MRKIQISEGIIRYSFDPAPGHFFADSIYAVVSGEKALLIDAGYENEALQAMGDLMENGLKLEGIIISHFHDDHMRGLKALPCVPVYGSSRFKTTLDIWTEKDEHEMFTPSILVKDTVSLEFGEHKISIIPSPGHSACTVLVKLNGAYLHIADELIFSPEQEPVLPVADPDCLESHIESLNRLKDYSKYTFLPAHGLPFSGAEEIERQIDQRLAYLNAISNAGREISFEEASRNSGGFLHSEWHKYNYGE